MSSRKKQVSLNLSERPPEDQAEHLEENAAEEQPEDHSHEYDATFKGWMQSQAPAILPLLVPGVEYKEDLNTEAVPPVMRADKVFLVHYQGIQQILHIEFETRSKTAIRSRLMVYNTLLHYKHKCPVTTMVIYPFKTSLPKSPYVVRSGERTILTFEFDTLPLFEKKARSYVEQHQTCIYPLLATMPDIDPDLMESVIEELSELYTDDRKTFSEQVSWMSLLLERNKSVDDVVKQEIKERVPVFEQLWEESPTVQKMRAQYYEKGKLEDRQQTVVEFVQVRFPVLTELAQRQAQLCQNAELLHTVTQQLYAAPDDGVAQRLLESLSGI
jgi:hypothetical protein